MAMLLILPSLSTLDLFFLGTLMTDRTSRTTPFKPVKLFRQCCPKSSGIPQSPSRDANLGPSRILIGNFSKCSTRAPSAGF
eukprot:2407360-Ditylum_brightwellii.AAC.1